MALGFIADKEQIAAVIGCAGFATLLTAKTGHLARTPLHHGPQQLLHGAGRRLAADPASRLGCCGGVGLAALA